MTTTSDPQSAPSMQADIERIFDAQCLAQQVARDSDTAARLAKLGRLRAAIESRSERIFAALRSDLSKPEEEAVADFGAPLWEIELANAGLEDWMKSKVFAPTDGAEGATARIDYIPKGKVLIFAPWNYPFALALQPLVAAISAGNTAVIKPSEMTPATSKIIVEIVRNCFDEGEVAVIEGGPDVARALLDYPFDHVFFTGSTHTGRLVMSAAAKHLASVTLELGGKSPVIIDKGFDPCVAAQRIFSGKFDNAGQVCVSPDHVWISQNEQERFCEELTRLVQEKYYANGSFKKGAMAQIINPDNLKRLCDLLEDAVARGARIVQGGATHAGWLEPTILTDVSLDAEIMKQEIFGPILPILTYSNTDLPLSVISEQGKPLALYVFSDRPAFVEDILSKTSSGGVTINDVVRHPTEAKLPFGGTGSSGTGAYHGLFGFLELSHQRGLYSQGSGPTRPLMAQLDTR